jgi:polar amino acid transport system substrate-binding protein
MIRILLKRNPLFCIVICGMLTGAMPVTLSAQSHTAAAPSGVLTVGVAGSPPFVIDTAMKEGISLEIWQLLAQQMGCTYRLSFFDDVPEALAALEAGKLDVVAGPVSITSERAARMRFSQPYFQSSLSILSRTDTPSLWMRISPFFSRRFFIAVIIFLLILGCVGALLWLAEREQNTEQFPRETARGIANGMWCAIVTMSTTGYGDKSPVTFWGRIIAGSWMVISLIFATTMVAGIASTLTLTGMNATVISTANELSEKKVAVVDNSPAEFFVKTYGAKITAIQSLKEGYDLLKKKQVDAVVYDRPQLLYFMQQHHDESAAVSVAEYDRQGYGFALPLHTALLHQVNVALLQIEESGRADQITNAWLGNKR